MAKATRSEGASSEAPSKKRFAATQVTRYLLGENDRWEKLITYDDATVAQSGENRRVGGDTAMLRAYSSDISFFGDEDTLVGNGVHFSEEDGYFLDCDSDIALKRVHGTVISHHHYGDCQEDWTVLVSFEKMGVWGSGMREKNEWTGLGYFSEGMRIEQWSVRLAKAGDE